VGIKFELPIATLEPLFSALHKVKPMELSRLEMKSIALLKHELYFELERMMEQPNEKEGRSIEFKKLFEEHRKKREARVKEFEESI
jgi:hypothetical protein